MYMQLLVAAIALTSVARADFDLETTVNLDDVQSVAVQSNDGAHVQKASTGSNDGDYLYGDIYHTDANTVLLTSDVFINEKGTYSYKFYVTSNKYEITKVIAINIGRQIGQVSLDSLKTDSHNSTLVLNIIMNKQEQSRVLIMTQGKLLGSGSANVKMSGLLLSLSSLLFFLRRLF